MDAAAGFPAVGFGPPQAWFTYTDQGTAPGTTVPSPAAPVFAINSTASSSTVPSVQVVVTYVNPAVAIALGVVFLGEQITIGMVIGFPLIIVGSVLATSRGAGSIEPAP